MQAIFIFLFVALSQAVFGNPVKRKCPDNFDFSVGRSCYKYVDDTSLFRYDDAASYCTNVIDGKLAVLDKNRKLRAAINFFYTKYHDEAAEGGVPTAWIDGRWVPGTRHVQHSNGHVNKHPLWMTSTVNRETGEPFHWPSAVLFGNDARCVVASLWRPSSLSEGIHERSGIYNVPCNSYYFTHALCEVQL